MFTWGWNKFEKNLSKTLSVPLPSPRLSEFAKFYSQRKISKRTNKILMMTNLIHRFPHISTCGQARIDFIDEQIVNTKDSINIYFQN